MNRRAPRSALIMQALFDFEALGEPGMRELAGRLTRKELRWLGAHHPDNRMRKMCFELTNVRIGRDTVINLGFVVSDDYEPLLTIGERVAIAPHVVVVCASAPNSSRLGDLPEVRDRLVVRVPVTIEDDAWIGCNAVILPGVTIGRMSIIGAGAVVSKDVPPYHIVAGVPATILRSLTTKD